MHKFCIQNQHVKNHLVKSKLCLTKHKKIEQKKKKKKKKKEKAGGNVKNNTSKQNFLENQGQSAKGNIRNTEKIKASPKTYKKKEIEGQKKIK